MDFDLTLKRHLEFHRVVIKGTPDLPTIVASLQLLGVESEEWSVRKAAVDLRGLRTPFNESEQREIGFQVASSWAHMERVAIIVPAGQLTGAGERVARHNGLNAKSFEGLDAALRWLLAP